jgi:SnoaL-like polyketide cyclase
MTMTPTEVARRYGETWNGRDADALVAAFKEGGILCHPDTYPGVSGEAIGAFVKGLWTSFSRLSYRTAQRWRNCAKSGRQSLVSARHPYSQGTDGSEPTGRGIALKGVSIIKVEGDKIVSDHIYFDRMAAVAQLAPK